MSPKIKTAYRLSIALAVLMFVQSILGLLYRGEYRDAAWIKLTWLGNDAVTLLIAVPLLIAALIYAARGSKRGLLLWLGLLGYSFYNYAYYLFGAALNAFFLFYIAALVLTVITLILSLSRIDIPALASSFRERTPVRLIGPYLTFVGVGLGSFWVIFWAAYVFAGKPTPIEPEAFKVVAAIDISMIVTLLVSGGILLWMRNAWGYVIAAIASILGSLYLIVLSVNSFLMIQRGLAEAPGELPIWGTLAVLTTITAFLLLINVRNERVRG